MITPGKYSVWFKTPVGEGAGVVGSALTGNWVAAIPRLHMRDSGTQKGEHFKASLSARRVAPGPPRCVWTG